MIKLGVNEYITNREYHGDKTFLSSSTLKEILKSPAGYYKKYILGEREDSGNESAFALGESLHTKILEPERSHTILVYPGQRRGSAWQTFKSENIGKTIITEMEAVKLEAMVESYTANSVARSVIENCQYEHTLTAIVNDVPLKVRCDAINVERGFISDVKSTGYSSDLESFTQVIDDLSYHLSGAMYCHVAEVVYGKPFDFYFVVVSKSDMNCRVFKLTNRGKTNGLAKMLSAIETYKHCLLTNTWPDVSLDSDELITEVTNDCD